MRRSLSTVVAGILIAANSAVLSAESSLFSNVRAASVFTSSGGTAAVAPPLVGSERTEVKVTAAGQLSRLLNQAGFESKEIDERVVTTKKQLDPWSFPVLVTISEDETRLGIVLLLSAVKEGQVPADKLLSLLELNRKHAPSQFAYSSQRKRIELYRSIKNQDVTGQQLREKIDLLANLAKETEGFWQFDAATASESPAADSTETGTKTTSLVGRWSAARSESEAFAAKFEANGTFTLVYVKQGRQTRSTGKFTLQGQSLTLEGNQGLRLTGSVISQSDEEFRFLPKDSSSGATPLTFKKAT